MIHGTEAHENPEILSQNHPENPVAKAEWHAPLLEEIPIASETRQDLGMGGDLSILAS